MNVEEAPYPRRGTGWAFVAVLALASILSVVDRAILNIVVDPVKTSLGLSDVQLSLLQGLAFGLLYAVAGIPLGLLADRYSRRWLIIVGMVLWSCATIASGLAQSFGALFAARILVGLGEAALGPAAISLIADLFPPNARGRPLSVFLMGQAIASGAAVTAAGSILQAAKSGAFAALPIVGGLTPWRLVFVFCGVAGFLAVAALFAVREPARRGVGQGGNLAQQAATCFRYMGHNGRVFPPFYFGFALFFAAAYGSGAWSPTMLLRGFHATPGDLARWLGPLSIACGLAGPWIGGMLVDRAARRDDPVAKLAILAFAPLLAIPSALAVFAPGLFPAIVLVALSAGVTPLIGVITFAALQTMVPGRMRGIAIALTGLLNTLVGASLGPLLVATFTQHLYRDPALVGYSIATLAVPALLLASISFGLAFIGCRERLKTGGELTALMTARAG